MALNFILQVYKGLVGPFGDVYSFGMIITCLCHSYDEQKEVKFVH